MRTLLQLTCLPEISEGKPQRAAIQRVLCRPPLDALLAYAKQPVAGSDAWWLVVTAADDDAPAVAPPPTAAPPLPEPPAEPPLPPSPATLLRSSSSGAERTVAAATIAFDKDAMCTAPATTFGYRDMKFILTADVPLYDVMAV